MEVSIKCEAIYGENCKKHKEKNKICAIGIVEEYNVKRICPRIRGCISLSRARDIALGERGREREKERESERDFRIFYLRISSILRTRKNFSYRAAESQHEIHIYAKRVARLGLVPSASYLYIAADSVISRTASPLKVDGRFDSGARMNLPRTWRDFYRGS